MVVVEEEIETRHASACRQPLSIEFAKFYQPVRCTPASTMGVFKVPWYQSSK